MNWALLGCDDEAIAVARAVAAAPGEALVWACELGQARALVGQLAPTARLADAWETLLDVGEADVVIVARDDNSERRADQLRKLVAAGVTLLVSHPISPDMLLYFELEMAREGTAAVLVPNLAQRAAPAIVELFEILARGSEGGIGVLEQVVFERRMADRTRQAVECQLARDMDLARALCGELTQVSAHAPASAEPFAQVGVQVSGPAGVMVRWNVGPPDQNSPSRMTLVGNRGKATLEMPSAPARWTIVGQTTKGDVRDSFDRWEGGDWAIEHVRRARAGELLSPGWIDAARSVELAEAVERSLKRGRTIELHQEQYNEQGVFKGAMAAAGCLLLLVSLLVLVVAAAAAGLGIPLAGYAPHALLGILTLFLLLQLLQLVFPANDAARASSASESGETR